MTGRAAVRGLARPDVYRGIRPCAKCPFRSDVTPYIGAARASEISRALLEGSGFTCHETTVAVDSDVDDGDDMRPGDNAMECAGALITLERGEGANQMMRVAERVGLYDPARLDMTAPTYGSLAEWVRAVRAHEGGAPTVTVDGEALALEHCGVVGPTCDDPAGYAVGGGAMDNPEPPTCDPTDTCQHCGATACKACRGPSERTPFGLLWSCSSCAEDEG